MKAWWTSSAGARSRSSRVQGPRTTSGISTIVALSNPFGRTRRTIHRYVALLFLVSPVSGRPARRASLPAADRAVFDARHEFFVAHRSPVAARPERLLQ